jgi:hypothetical protein
MEGIRVSFWEFLTMVVIGALMGAIIGVQL